MLKKYINKSGDMFFAHESAIIDSSDDIGKDTKIWHFSHIFSNTVLGHNCIVGQNVMIGPEVEIGNNCKVQNNVSIYKGVELADEVFCGPSCVFTNVINPRAFIEKKSEFLITKVERGVTIGANATIICGVKLGEYSLIGAGSVVTKDVPSFGLVVGNPARHVGWVGHSGERLDSNLICPVTGRKYEENKLGILSEKVT